MTERSGIAHALPLLRGPGGTPAQGADWRRAVGNAKEAVDPALAQALHGVFAGHVAYEDRGAFHTGFIRDAIGRFVEAAFLFLRVGGNPAAWTVADVARAAGAPWRVTRAGAVRVGAESWGALALDDVSVVSEAPDRRRYELAGAVLGVDPGVSVTLPLEAGPTAVQVDSVTHRIEGERHDIGNKLDFLKTTVKFALKRKEFSKPFLKFLRETLAEYEK